MLDGRGAGGSVGAAGDLRPSDGQCGPCWCGVFWARVGGGGGWVASGISCGIDVRGTYRRRAGFWWCGRDGSVAAVRF